MDVRSLYTNISNEDGLRALTKTLGNRQTKLPNTNTSITLMNHVLTLNNFTFNCDHYLQIKGCAMGTIAAPSYATIYMADFEETYIYPQIRDTCMFYCRYIQGR